MSESAALLAEAIKKSENMVFFGGAGVSTESGIPDFRSSGGIYNQKYKYPPEQIVSHTFFVYSPEVFFEFYKEKMIFTEAKNIDGLHQAAGSKNVYELHGSIHRNYCTKCGTFYGLDAVVNSKEVVPRCEKCGAIIKPDVVLYEEGLDGGVIDGSVRAIRKADTMIIGGTSLNVYPAAGLIHDFKGHTLILINKSATPADSRADIVIREPIGEVMGEAMELI